MQSASQILWELFGKPNSELKSAEHDSEPCWVCGGESTFGVSRLDWLGSSFVGQNRVKAPRSKTVCSACVYLCSRTSPVPGRPPKEGKEHGGNFRNYSHLFEAGAYSNASKGEKPAILAFLRKQHTGTWFAAIAESGQKHVVPWVPVNLPGTRRGLVLFEEMIVELPRHGSIEWTLVEHMTYLLTAGATKESVGTGTYQPGEWQRCEHAIRDFELRWGYARRSQFWFLALFLAQRDEGLVKVRVDAEKAQQKSKKEAKGGRKAGRKAERPVENVDCGGVVGSQERVSANPAGECAKELGHASDTHEDSNQDGGKPGAVGNATAKRARRSSGSESKQLDLFSGFGFGNS